MEKGAFSGLICDLKQRRVFTRIHGDQALSAAPLRPAVRTRKVTKVTARQFSAPPAMKRSLALPEMGINEIKRARGLAVHRIVRQHFDAGTFGGV